MTELAEKLNKRVNSLSDENGRLKEEIAILKKALFGQKSERIISSDAQLELDLGVDGVEPPASEPEESKTRKSRKGKKLSRFEIPEDLPCEEIILDVPEEDRICLETDKPMEFFKYEETKKLAYKPGSYFVKKFLRPVYKSSSTNEFIIAPLPDFPIDKCRADVTLLASILIQKFADHLPLYRIEEILKRSGINIQRQTLCRWVLKLGEVLMPLYDLMMQKTLNSDRIFTDATGLNYLVKGKGSQKGYIWVYCGGEQQPQSKSPPYLISVYSRWKTHSSGKSLKAI